MMDQLDIGSSSEIDLESGGTTDEDVGDTHPNLSGLSPKKETERSWSKDLGEELLDWSDGMQSSHSDSRLSISDEILIETEETWPCVLREVKGNVSDKKTTHEKPKKPNSTRHPKPPRPPKGLSLDPVDMRLAKEVSELAILKRKRVERMKNLRKARKEKASSRSSTSIVATVITALFFLVIIFHVHKLYTGQVTSGTKV